MIAFAIVLSLPGAGPAAAQSLEEQTRRPPGTNSLDNDSMDLRGRTADQGGTNSLDNDSMDLRGRTADQDGTNSLDDGSLQGGDQADPGDDQADPD
jgi:hypothetical protein